MQVNKQSAAIIYSIVRMPNCCGHCREYVHQGGTDSVNLLDNTITTQENKQLTSNMGGEGGSGQNARLS